VEFNAVRVQILSKVDLPSLNEVISLVRAEEGRRGVMLESTPVDSSAILILKAHNQNRGPPKEKKKAMDKESLWCTFYKKLRHTIERCWKLHGRTTTLGC